MKIDSAPLSDTSPRPEGQSRQEMPLPAPPRAVTPQPSMMVTPAHRPWSGRARVGLALGLALFILVLLVAIRTVLRPFIWAGVVCYILSPVVAMVQRRLKLRHGLSVTIVVLVLLGLVIWGTVVAIPVLRSDISALSDSLTSLNSVLTTYLPNQGTPSILGIPVQVTDLVRTAQTTITDLPHTVLRDGFSVASTAATTLLRFLTFLITTFYLLLDAPRLGGWLTRRLPPSSREETIHLARRVNAVWSEYLRAEVILILIMSMASLIALTILGVHFALLLAPIVGFLEIFPIIGPFFAIALVSAVALIGPANYGLSHAGYALLVALVFFVMRQLEDYLVIPNVVGHAVKLHPVVILFALLCGASIGGILGMFLAVPVTGALKVLGGYAYDRLVE